MTQKIRALILLGSISLTVFAEEATDSQQWEGQALKEVVTLSAVPVNIKVLLGVGNPGLEGVGDRGDAFNEIDLIDPRLPMRRFIVAGVGKNISLLALEKGGYEHFVEVFLFSDVDGTTVMKKNWVLPAFVKHKWVVPYVPTTLKEVIERIPDAARED
jgi:hypothetical protein